MLNPQEVEVTPETLLKGAPAEEDPWEETPQAIVPAPAPKPPVTHQAPVQFSAEEAAAAGLGGMSDEVSTMDFPTVNLGQKERFTGRDGRDFGTEMVGWFQSSMSQWFIGAKSNKNPPGKAPDYKIADPKTDTFYTFDSPVLPDDQRFNQSGKSLAEVKARWEAEGKLVGDDSEYLLIVVALDTLDQEVVIWQVAPASKRRWSSFINRLKIVLRPFSTVDEFVGKLRSVRIKAKVGQKVTAVANPFCPWDFEKV